MEVGLNLSEEPARSHNKGRSIHSSVQTELEMELMRLKRMLNIEENLKVVWSPNSSGHLSGEVRGKTIYIYDPDLKKAKETLRHEVIDYLVSHAIEPYKETTNMFIKKANEDAYRRKEKTVQALLGLMGDSEEETFAEKRDRNG